MRSAVERHAVDEQDNNDIPLVSKDEAIAEVRRWLEEEKVDPERIFTETSAQVIRYKDLISHLEQETPDGKLLLFAISRGRVMKRSRDQQSQALLQIVTPPPMPEKPPTS